MLDEVGLADQAQSRISSLSGGMRRRLLLAQALLGSPDLLILDEPLVSLDAEHRSSIVRLIAASGTTRSSIVATHHGDELAAVCRHVLVLAQGRLLFAGSPQDLAAEAQGQAWETSQPSHRPGERALGPERFRTVGAAPPGGRPAEPTVHDGYLATLLTASARP